MIEIINLKYEQPSKQYDFRIDRYTILGNIFPMSGEHNRNMVCNQFEEHFKNLILKDDWKDSDVYYLLNKMVNIYKKYGKLRLFCWCAPKRCHGITYRKYIEGEL